MKVWRYSRWDGSQKAFSLDADAALDALSDLMMEGLTAEEALAWMQRFNWLRVLNIRFTILAVLSACPDKIGDNPTEGE